MRDVSRHKSMDVLQTYVRDADLFRDHAGIGLLPQRNAAGLGDAADVVKRHSWA
jgi:hypothetical protein